MNEHLNSLDQVRSTAIDLGMNFGPKVLVALIIILAGYFAGRWVGKVMHRSLARIDLEPPVRQLLIRLVRLLVLAVFALLALQNLGVQLLPLLAGLGVLGAGIALATQGVLSNLVAGLTIIFSKPFRVGEYVSMLGVEGDVRAISLFNTTLGHPDRSRVVIPNRKIVGEILHNYGQIRQVDLMVGVAYSVDLNQALAAIDDIVQSNPRVLKDPAPVIQVTSLGESSIAIAVKPWVKVTEYGQASGEINKALVETFRARNIVMPFPQREVRIVSGAA
jgi:small conductance mechanosensitive channel